jgi:hypothetical protein
VVADVSEQLEGRPDQSRRGCCSRVKQRLLKQMAGVSSAVQRGGSQGMVTVDRKDADGPTMVVAVSKDGTKIASWRSGRGPALVLVHGSALDHSQWMASCRS